MNVSAKNLGVAILVVAIVALLSGCATSGQPAPSRASISSKPWITFQPIASVEDIQKLQPDEEVAMACAKCKSIAVTTRRQLTTKPSGGTVEEIRIVDQCPGCGGVMTVRGDKQTQMVHACSKCGENSAFCCVTMKGGPPTPGMKK